MLSARKDWMIPIYAIQFKYPKSIGEKATDLLPQVGFSDKAQSLTSLRLAARSKRARAKPGCIAPASAALKG